GGFDETRLEALRPSPAPQEAVERGQNGEEGAPKGDLPQHRDGPKAAPKQRNDEAHAHASENDTRRPLSAAHVPVIYALRGDGYGPRSTKRLRQPDAPASSTPSDAPASSMPTTTATS